ncbi:hypothetical protein ACQJBY_032502 [Aegilops geniculata]
MSISSATTTNPACPPFTAAIPDVQQHSAKPVDAAAREVPISTFPHLPWMFMLLCPKWQICSAAYDIIELHSFVLSLFPYSSSATTILCLLLDSSADILQLL